MTDNKSQNSGEGRTLRNIRERVFKTIQIGYTADTVSKIFDIVIAGAILINLFLVFLKPLIYLLHIFRFLILSNLLR